MWTKKQTKKGWGGGGGGERHQNKQMNMYTEKKALLEKVEQEQGHALKSWIFHLIYYYYY